MARDSHVAETETTNTRARETLPRVLAASLLVLGVVLRLIGLRKDLWLDEVWSIQVATQMQSAMDVFTLHHEINHHLNTIWLYFIGANGNEAAYHSLSMVCGVAAVAVAGLIGFRRGAATGLITMLLVAVSYELVIFSSEARGYSSLVLGCLSSFYCLERYHDAASPRWAAAYFAATMLGLLSQPIFASVIASAALWTAYRSYAARRSPGDIIGATVRVHAAPVACFLLLYFMDLRLVVAGGGSPSRSLIDAYGTSLAWALGAPAAAAAQLLGAVIAVWAFVAGVQRLRRANADAFVFYAAVIVIFPIALVVVRGSDYVYTRHFMVSATFLLLLLGGLLGAWWDAGQRRACAAVLAVFVIVNGRHLADFAEHGRGQYREAIAYMAAETPGASVSIAGDQDFRVGVELSYYLPRAMTTKQGTYFDQGSWPAGGPQWIIAQRESFMPVAPVEAVLTDGAGGQYDLVKTYPTAPLTGLHWFLYRHRALK